MTVAYLGKRSEQGREGPEIVIALVGAVGTDLDLVADALKRALHEVDYEPHVIRLSDLLRQIDRFRNLPVQRYDKRLSELMTAGTEFREKVQRGDAMAPLAIAAIRAVRQAHWTSEEPQQAVNASDGDRRPVPRSAYILRSLKHPKEVEAFRNVYGAAFLLVAAYAARAERVEHLAQKIADSYNVMVGDAHREAAKQLSERDEAEAGKKLGQNVRKTFPLADVFINVSDEEQTRAAIRRFIELVFGYPFHTPTRDEYGMFHAQAAALRSADLGRQVGAVISTRRGDLVAVGTNEVPKAGGGLYWPEDSPDHRDFKRGYDANDRIKREILHELLERLQQTNWLSSEKTEQDVQELIQGTLAKREASPLVEAKFAGLIEFVRAVHAEMAALMDAARRGASVRGCTLYTTTFPCHDCAKHIIAAGIRRVVYIEPYPKSRAEELYREAIAVDDPEASSSKVRFGPFVGVAPRKYMDLFQQEDGVRKGPDGSISQWPKTGVVPKFESTPSAYLSKESARLESLRGAMEEADLHFLDGEGEQR